jgi:hypothetical protein
MRVVEELRLIGDLLVETPEGEVDGAAGRAAASTACGEGRGEDGDERGEKGRWWDAT